MNDKEQEVYYHSCKPEIVKGAVITAYRKGYHRVVRVFEQYCGFADDPALLVEYYQVVTAKGTKSCGKRLYTCHVDYCELVDAKEVFQNKLDELHTLYFNLVEAINSGS